MFPGIWIVATIIVSYYIVYLLEESLGTMYPKIDTSVTYGIGFCLLATAGKGTFLIEKVQGNL